MAPPVTIHATVRLGGGTLPLTSRTRFRWIDLSEESLERMVTESASAEANRPRTRRSPLGASRSGTLTSTRVSGVRARTASHEAASDPGTTSRANAREIVWAGVIAMIYCCGGNS